MESDRRSRRRQGAEGIRCEMKYKFTFRNILQRNLLFLYNKIYQCDIIKEVKDVLFV